MVVAEVNILSEAQEYCKSIVNSITEEHNNTYLHSYEHLNISIEFSNRLSKTLGYCRTYRNKRTCEVFFSNIFLKSCWSKGDKESIRELVIHEVSHAIVRVLYGYGHGHDNLFKNTVIRLGGTLTKRSSANQGYKPYRYIYKCPNCGKEIKRKRIGVWACANCCKKYNSGKYTDKYKFELVKDRGRVDTWE